MTVNRTWHIILVLMGIAGGIILAVPHLPDPIWQDEAYTLIKFSDSGVLFPFTDYHIPNNHPLFSSLMSLWWDWGDSIVSIRLLPFILFILTLLLFAWTASAIGGPAVGIFALLMFATSQVTENFGVQIRGYGLSWLPTIACLLSLPSYIETGKTKWLMIFMSAAALNVAILPSNIFISMVFILWGAGLLLLDRQIKIRLKLKQIFFLTIGPLIGASSYCLIWKQVLIQSNKNWSSWHYPGIALHWLQATTADFILLAPFMLLGLILLIKASLTERSLAIGSPRNQLALCTSMLLAFLLWIVLVPNPPFPRTFMPLLPVWYFCLGIFIAASFAFLAARFPKVIKKTFVPLVSVFFCTVLLYRQPCSGIGAPDKSVPNLCTQYYHAKNYNPFQTILLLSLTTGNDAPPVVTDFEGNYALGFIMASNKIEDFQLMHYGRWLKIHAPNIPYPPLIVTRDKEQLLNILQEMGLPEKEYTLVTSTGYFKIFNIQEAAE